MRKNRSREINVFSMSALDLFASALGAFIIIAVIALPYYLNTDKHKFDHQFENVGDISSKNRFFIVTMYWDTNKEQDIDLIVVDPQGRKYNYSNSKHNGSNAKLVFDSIGVKRGTEMWIDNEIDTRRSGKWKIYYKNQKNIKNVNVMGSVYTNNGSYDFPVHKMNGQVTHHVATISINTGSNGTYGLTVTSH